MTTLNCPAASAPFQSRAAGRSRRGIRLPFVGRFQRKFAAWKGGSQARYLGRLVQYTLQQRTLLLLTVVTGVVGFMLAFIYPWLIGAAIDHVIAPRPVDGVLPTAAQRSHFLLVLILVGTATAVGHGVVGYARGMCTIHLGHRIVTQLRRDLFDHFQRLSLHFYSKERTGSIASRLLHDVHAATSIIYGGIIVVGLDVIQLMIAVGLLLSLNWKLALASLLVLPMYGLTFKVFNPQVRRASEKLHHHYCKISGNIQEQLAGIALVKTYAAEEREHKRFSRDMEEHHEKVVDQSHVGHMVGAVSEILVHAGTMIVVGYGSWLAIHGTMTAGDITRFLGYVGIMYGPVRRFAELNMVYQNSLTAITRVFRVFDVTPKIADKPGVLTAAPERGAVRFEGVKFRYQDDSDESRYSLEDTDAGNPAPAARAAAQAPWVLNGIDFSAKPGERIAFVGPSARARPPWCPCCPGCTTSAKAGSPSTTSTCGPIPSRGCGRASASCSRTRSSSAAPSARTSPTAGPTPPTPR